MPIPPLNLIEPRDAVQRVRDAFECRGEEAVQFLSDRWLSGEITLRFIAGKPPGGADPGMADWFVGAIILPDKWLPRHAVSEPEGDPECQRIPGRTFPFTFDRQELEAALKAAGAGARPAGPTAAAVGATQSLSADRPRVRKSDPRNKREAMIEGLKKALADGALKKGSPVSLKAAHKAMLDALGCRVAPVGMGDDAFAKHCKPWLIEHGIYR